MEQSVTASIARWHTSIHSTNPSICCQLAGNSVPPTNHRVALKHSREVWLESSATEDAPVAVSSHFMVEICVASTIDEFIRSQIGSHTEECPPCQGSTCKPCSTAHRCMFNSIIHLRGEGAGRSQHEATSFESHKLHDEQTVQRPAAGPNCALKLPKKCTRPYLPTQPPAAAAPSAAAHADKCLHTPGH